MFSKTSKLGLRSKIVAVAFAAAAAATAPATSASAATGGGCMPLKSFDFGSVNACIGASGSSVIGDFYLHLNSGYKVNTYAYIEDVSTYHNYSVQSHSGYTGYQHIVLPYVAGIHGHRYETYLNVSKVGGTTSYWVNSYLLSF